MTKYLAWAALAALGCAAFAPPAAAQIGIDIGVGGDPYYGDPYYDGPYYDDRYYGDRYYGDPYYPGVRVYIGPSAFREDCYDHRSVRWIDGRRFVRTVRVCED